MCESRFYYCNANFFLPQMFSKTWYCCTRLFVTNQLEFVLLFQSQALPKSQYITNERKHLLVWCSTVHPGCCIFCSLLSKRGKPQSLFCVFFGHLAPISKIFESLYCINSPLFRRHHFSSGEILLYC